MAARLSSIVSVFQCSSEQPAMIRAATVIMESLTKPVRSLPTHEPVWWSLNQDVPSVAFCFDHWKAESTGRRSCLTADNLSCRKSKIFSEAASVLPGISRDSKSLVCTGTTDVMNRYAQRNVISVYLSSMREMFSMRLFHSSERPDPSSILWQNGCC